MEKKSASRLEWLQLVGLLPFTVGFFLALYTILGSLLKFAIPSLGKKLIASFSEIGIDIGNHPFQILSIAIGLMSVGGGIIFIAGLWARKNERLLRERLRALRSALQRFKAERGDYPGDLTQLVTAGYLRRIPADPMCWPSRNWHEVRPSAHEGIRDVRSRSQSSALDGTSYDTW